MTEDSSATATNRAALKRFYERKDVARVKNVDALFLRFEEADILHFVEHKYHEPVEGWVTSGASSSPTAAAEAADVRASQGFFAAPVSLLRRSFKKKGPVSALKGQSAPNSQSLANIVVSNSDSEDEAEETSAAPSASTPTKKKQETRIHFANVVAPTPPMPEELARVSSSDGGDEPARSTASVRLTPEEVNAKIAEITRKEKEALESARKEEAEIKQKQLRAKEAIARAMQELAEKEKELEEVKRQMEVERKRDAQVKDRRKTMNHLSAMSASMMTELRREEAIAEGQEPPAEDDQKFSTQDLAAEEEAIKLEEEDVKRKEALLAQQAKVAEDQKQAVIQRVQEAESEALLLMVKENEILRTEVAISNRLQIVDELNAPVEAAATADATEEDAEEEEVVVVDENTVMDDDALMPLMAGGVSASGGGGGGESKRLTRYERKLQEALVAEPAKPKSVMGALLGRMTVSGGKKQPQLAAMAEEDAAAPPQPAAAEEDDTPRPESLAPSTTPPPMAAPLSPTSAATGLPQPGTVEYTKFLEFQRFQQQQFQAFQEQQNNPSPAAVVVEQPSIKFIPEALKEQVSELMDENAKLKHELQEARLLAENQRLKRELEEAKRLAAPPPAFASPQIVYVTAPAAVAAAAAPAPAASSGGEPVDDGSGFKRYPAGHADLEKYRKMQKTGLPQGPIENAMMRDFIHPASLYGDNAMNNPKPKPGGAAAPKPAAAAAPAAAGAPGEFRKLAADHPDMEKYRKMQKTGLPQGPIENAMMRDFIHPASLYGANAMNDPKPRPGAAAAAAAPAASSGGGGASGEFRKLAADHPDMEKYRKMQKTGLPQGPIENAMMRDFIHPASLYGANAMNDPKPKPGGGGAAGGGLKPAPKPVAAPAPVAAAPANGKPPPGMSMMEEMKWKQAQKAKEGPKAPLVIKPVEKPVAAAGPAVMKLGDKPPPGLSMMEEMKWKQAQKKLKEEEDAKNGIAAKPAITDFQKPGPKYGAAAAAPVAPNFKVGLKSTPGSAFPGAVPKPAAAPATPSWQKAPTKAVIQTATNLAVAAPVANLDALVSLFVGAKISSDNAKKYAAALAAEGFDAPEKLALVDDADLAACGITARFDIKIINSLKTNLPKVATATPSAAAAVVAAAPKPGYSAAPKPGPSLPTYGQSAPIKPNFVINKPAVAAPAPAPATNKPNFVINKPAAAAPAPALAAAGIKPNFVINKPAIPAPAPAAAANKPTFGGGGVGAGRPPLKSSADAQKAKDAERLAFVMSLGAPLDSYKKPKQIG